MTKPRVIAIQHVPFEGPAEIEEWLSARGLAVEVYLQGDGVEIPKLDEGDVLLVMGGPMGVYDSDTYPWLNLEIDYIRDAIDRNCYVLGICLGAQLIAKALGAEVFSGETKEIGWFPVSRAGGHCSDKASRLRALAEFTPLHWHGDTYTLPLGAERLYESEAFSEQAFLFKDRTLALQFHLEMGEKDAAEICKHCAKEIDGSSSTQSVDSIMSQKERFRQSQAVLNELLLCFFESDARF